MVVVDLVNASLLYCIILICYHLSAIPALADIYVDYLFCYWGCFFLAFLTHTPTDSALKALGLESLVSQEEAEMSHDSDTI